MNGRFAGLMVGQEAVLTKVIGAAEVDAFAEVSGDFNPLHVDEGFARATEFGRRVGENSAGGTDHGMGGVMFFMGGGVPGGRMHGDWTGLADGVLLGPGDLPVRYNYRDLLAPILQRQAPGVALEKVFPGHAFAPMGLLS